MKHILKDAGHWFLLLFLTDAVFLFATWIIRREAFRYMSLFLSLFALLAWLAGIGFEYRRRKKAQEALLHFLESPGEGTKEELLQWGENRELMDSLCTQLLAQAEQTNEKTVELCQYREYIEAWVHEAKTPLSLFPLVLDNHREEMSPYVYGRMHYIRHQLSEGVDRILYYARLSADHSDYKFAEFDLRECLEEVVEAYGDFLEEKRIAVERELLPLSVVSDRKVVSFLLSQLIGNAVKYADGSEGRIRITMDQEEERVRLGIYNNGEGVPPEDRPFLFDKGFTGNHPNRQKATGMGLYLVGKYAEKLCLEVGLTEDMPFESGFGIELVFPL